MWHSMQLSIVKSSPTSAGPLTTVPLYTPLTWRCPTLPATTATSPLLPLLPVLMGLSRMLLSPKPAPATPPAPAAAAAAAAGGAGAALTPGHAACYSCEWSLNADGGLPPAGPYSSPSSFDRSYTCRIAPLLCSHSLK
eukprot:GHRQ01022192.1.p1 GENE.GHRQ01022192.1~~GHRQ01022192.1.p1  ORF type:complete len:138 (-),score=47.35 GHRQ01022192.1:607-1020(-)